MCSRGPKGTKEKNEEIKKLISTSGVAVCGRSQIVDATNSVEAPDL